MKRSSSVPALKNLSLAISTALVSIPLSVVAQDAADGDENERVIEEILVTGTRIHRTVNTHSQEVVRYTFEDMVSSGDISVAEALRSSTLNSFGSFSDQPLDASQSNAMLDLRGIGSDRNLVVLNGRRTVGSPAADGSGAVNLNMIPFAAVDRIEIIPDGASAVYGSDAITGVTNIILKRNYEGLTVQARYGDRSEDDGTEESASVLVGASNDRGNITFSLEYDKRDPIYDADRDYTHPRWEDYDGDGVIMGYEETWGVSYYGYTLVNPSYDPEIPYDPSNPSTWPLTPGADCTEGDGFTGAISGDAIFGEGSGFYCGYAYGLIAARRAGLERINSWVSADYQLTDAVELYTDVVISQIDSFGRYAPPAFEGPPFPADPRNDIGAEWGRFRLVEFGPRDFLVADTLTDINLGARGEFADSVSWETYYTYSDYVSTGIGNDRLSWAGFAYNLHNGIDDRDTYIANMKATLLNDFRQNLQKLFGGMQFDLFDTPAGTVTAYVGAEYFKTDYTTRFDAQSEAGLIAGGRAPESIAATRDVAAVFAEAVIPLFDWWEVDLALRYDDYSDFGSETSPRIGTVLRLPSYEALRLKASWGEGFRAPNLRSIFGFRGVTLDSLQLDYYGCELNGLAPEDCHFVPMDIYHGANPDLQAEHSESWSVGLDWQFADRWLAGVNYFNLELSDQIENAEVRGQLMTDWFSGGNNPNVQRNEQGWAVRVDTGWQNSYVPLDYETIDFALSGTVPTPLGVLGLQANASKYLTYEGEITFGTGETMNLVGFRGAPEWRGNVLLTWNLNNAFASLNWDYISSQTDFIFRQKVPAWNIFNIQAGYDFGRFGTFTLGANNVENKGPDLDENGLPIQQNLYLYDITGRVIYLSYRVEL